MEFRITYPVLFLQNYPTTDKRDLSNESPTLCETIIEQAIKTTKRNKSA